MDVVWTDTRNGATADDIYFAKRSAATGSWSTSVRVNDDAAGKHQNDPSIAISSTGEAIAVWYDERGGGSKKYIYSARLTTGGSTWSANIKVSSDQNAVKAEPEVAIDSTGIACAVWRDHRNGNADIWFATLASGGSAWSTNTKISDDSGTASQDSPDVGVDTAGNVIAVWNDARVTPSQIRASRRPAGSSTWSANVVLGGSTSNTPTLQVRPDGRAYTAWFNGTPGTLTTVWGSEYDPAAGTWAAAEHLTDTAEEAANPVVGFTTPQLIVAYQRRPSGGNYDIYQRRKSLVDVESFYAYDRLYRLTTVAGPDGPRTYTYDPAGNRLTRVASGTTAYTYDRADRITAAGGAAITVDANGNMTVRGADLFAFDQANRMTTATVAGSSETYVYNGDGTRFSGQVGANPAIRYVSDVNLAVPVTIDDGTRKYADGLGLAFDVVGSTLEIYHADRLGSVRALTNGAGTVTAGYRSDENGILAASSGSSAQPFGFTGEPRDATGLTYLRARYYDPSIGRFLSRDRWGGFTLISASLNRCAYADNNPLTLIDPTPECLRRVPAPRGILPQAFEDPVGVPYKAVHNGLFEVVEEAPRQSAIASLHPGGLATAFAGQGDEGGPSIVGVRAPRNQTTCLQGVDEARDVAWRAGQCPAQVALRHRALQTEAPQELGPRTTQTALGQSSIHAIGQQDRQLEQPFNCQVGPRRGLTLPQLV